MPDYPKADANTISRAYRLSLPLFFSFIILLGQVGSAQAQDLVNARVINSKDKILIGDPIRLEISIEHRAGNNYRLKLDAQGLGFFEVRGQPEEQTRAIDSQKTETTIDLTLIPFQTGKLPIPPLLLTRADGGQLQTPALQVEVEALTAPQEQQIKDVRPLPDAPRNGWLQPVYFTLLLASAVFYWGLRFFNARAMRWALALVALLAARDQTAAAPVSLPRLTLEDEAIAKLRLLLASGLAAADIKRYHIQLADIMNDYAAARYGKSGQEYTSEELFALFKVKGVPALVNSTFEEILDACDMVKFARRQPDAETAQHSARQAIDLLKALNFTAQVKSS